MKEVKLTWNELTEEQKEQAILQYAYIREEEEQEPCSEERAREDTPWCTGFYVNKDGYVFVDI